MVDDGDGIEAVERGDGAVGEPGHVAVAQPPPAGEQGGDPRVQGDAEILPCGRPALAVAVGALHGTARDVVLERQHGAPRRIAEVV
jgi:hypothetical protein